MTRWETERAKFGGAVSEGRRLFIIVITIIDTQQGYVQAKQQCTLRRRLAIIHAHVIENTHPQSYNREERLRVTRTRS
jgi:hypothetical protein